MTWAQFEEKEYELPLNHELAGTNPNLWSPGQVFERHLGIDAALLTYHSRFWTMAGMSMPLSGVTLRDFNFGYLWRRIGRARPLPGFSCNLFLQAKRPKVPPAAITQYVDQTIPAPRYQFDLTPHQQAALERLSRKLGRRALVAYACASFDTATELFQRIHQQQLVAGSTYVRADRLRGHESWVYNRPGTFGIACSEPELIDDAPLLDQINNIVSATQGSADSTPERSVTYLIRLATDVREVCEESTKEDVRALLFIEYSQLTRVLKETENPAFRAVAAYHDVSLFCMLYGLSWHVIG